MSVRDSALTARSLADFLDRIYQSDDTTLRGIAAQLRVFAAEEPEFLRRNLYYHSIFFIEALLDRRLKERRID